MATGGYGRLIQQARDERGLSQSRLAEKVFVNARTVSRWETERTRPSGESIKLLAIVLEIPIEDLEAAIAATPMASSTTDRQSPKQAVVSGHGVQPAEVPAQEPLAGQMGPPKFRGRWLQHALVAAGLAVIGAIGVLLLRPWLENGGESPEKGGTSTAQFARLPSPVGSAIPAGALAKAALGRDIEPDEATPCGSQNSAPRADWVFGPATVDGVEYDTAYRCSMLGGASGELIFSLDKKYSRVHLVMGFLSGSESGGDPVEFVVLRDGTFTPMTPFELEYGENSTLDYSVVGVSRLSIKVTGTGAAGAGEAPSTPVVASLLLF